jgi:hypothetical protein
MTEKTLTEWMDEGQTSSDPFQSTTGLQMKDGTTMSIQAGKYHYCSPRHNFTSYAEYSAFEIGFPSKKIDVLMEYIDGGEDTDPTSTVYGYVPKDVVEKAIEQCGGIEGFQAPPKT